VEKQLHPDVEKFKQFVKNHPKLIQRVRRGEVTWQEMYEDWYLLGEDDPKWDPYKDKNVEEQPSKESDGNWMNQIGSMLKKIDVNQFQSHLQQLNEALGSIQGVLAQFQQSNKQTRTRVEEKRPHPFSFRKD
jgi:hypothetical protein